MFRTAAGAYAKEEWTSFSDIGRSFGGVTLSRDAYLRVESAYVDAAVAFLLEDGIPELRVVGLENRTECSSAPVDGALVTASAFSAVFRSILRGEYWCKLEADTRFVHFGWDYYMYLGVSRRCERAIARARSFGLFVEDFVSPYLDREETG